MEGEMLKGHLDMIVLAALSSGPAHGYAVIEEIRRKSGQAFDLPEGTIYPAIANWQTVDDQIKTTIGTAIGVTRAPSSARSSRRPPRAAEPA